jgi:hypothetical protein
VGREKGNGTTGGCEVSEATISLGFDSVDEKTKGGVDETWFSHGRYTMDEIDRIMGTGTVIRSICGKISPSSILDTRDKQCKDVNRTSFIPSIILLGQAC